MCNCIQICLLLRGVAKDFCPRNFKLFGRVSKTCSDETAGCEEVGQRL